MQHSVSNGMASEAPFQTARGVEVRLPRPVAAFAGAFALSFLASKFLGLMPGFALDDYVIGDAASADGLWRQILSQGRFTFAAAHALIHAAGLQQSDFAAVGMIVASAFLGLLFQMTLAPWRPSSLLLWAAAGLFLGAHSYLAEYITFRQAIFPMALMAVLGWASLRAYSGYREGRRRWALAGVALGFAVLAVGTNQLMLSFLSIAVLLQEMKVDAGDATPGSSLRTAMRPLVRTALAVGAVLVAYVIISLLTVWVTQVDAGDSRTTLLGIESLPTRAVEVSVLLQRVMFGQEEFASVLAKACLWLAWAWLVFVAAIKRPAHAVMSVGFFVIGTALALLPIAVSAVWWPVPRTLIALPFAWTGALLIAASATSSRAQLPAAVALVCAAVLFGAHSSSLLQDQQRLNRWDAGRARQIADRVEELHPAVGKIVVVGATWSHPAAPTMAQGDMNMSALSVGWAIDALFDEATGRKVDVRLDNEMAAACKEKARFPAEQSMFEVAGEIVVCL